MTRRVESKEAREGGILKLAILGGADRIIRVPSVLPSGGISR